jgi:sialate O-acetylesterase
MVLQQQTEAPIRIYFNHTEGGLKAKDNQPVKGFAIAGLDHKYHIR